MIVYCVKDSDNNIVSYFSCPQIFETYAIDTDSEEFKAYSLKGYEPTSVAKQMKAYVGTLLSPTDFYVIRKYERNVDIPSSVSAYREKILQKCDEVEQIILAKSPSDLVSYDYKEEFLNM